MAVAAPLLDAFSALSDGTRCRMLLLLQQQELTVSEVCAVLQLPQSTISRHLKVLADVDLVVSRRDGTSRYYSLATEAAGHELQAAGGRDTTQPQAALHKPQAELWQLIRRELADRPGVAQDSRRLKGVLARRSEASQRFFATSAGQWDRLRDELFGVGFYWRALLGLLPDSWIVGDLGCGTGAVVAALAPHVARVIGVDASEEMLRAAERRLEGVSVEDAPGGAPANPPITNVTLRRGALEDLPLETGTLDAATFVLVLHHLPAPAMALAEAFRVLKPGGRLLIVDMAPHEREEYRQQMGHVWLGFSEEHMRRLLASAGFEAVKLLAMPPITEARGPALFAAAAAKGIKN